jgi:hypothetical protein
VTGDEKTANAGRATIPVTRPASRVTLMLLAGAVLFWGPGPQAAQPAPSGHAPGFASIDYYPTPNQMQMRSRLSGTEAQPLAGGVLMVKQLKLEMFAVNGQRQVVVNAPECVYDTLKGTAASAGDLLLENGDGKIRIEGKGFLWRQNDSVLTISNQVRTTIESGLTEKFTR